MKTVFNEIIKGTPIKIKLTHIDKDIATIRFSWKANERDNDFKWIGSAEPIVIKKARKFFGFHLKPNGGSGTIKSRDIYCSL